LRNHHSSRTHPSTSIVPKEQPICSRWRYAPREPSRAHGKLTPSHGFGLQRTQLTSTPASRTSAFTDGSVDPAERTPSPRSTSVRAIARSLHRPRTNESLAHLVVHTELALPRGNVEAPARCLGCGSRSLERDSQPGV
jgi:hypothetical protein